MFTGEGFPWDVFISALVIGIFRGIKSGKKDRREHEEAMKLKEEESSESS